MNKFKSLKEIFVKLKYILSKEQQKRSCFILIVMIGGAILETIGISLMLPFIQMMMNMEQYSDKWYVEILMRIFNTNNMFVIVVFMGITIILAFFLKNVYLIWASKIQIRFRCEITRDLSVRIFQSYMKRPYGFFVENNSSEFMRSINDDVSGVFFVLNYLFLLIQNLCTGFCIAVFIILTDPLISVATLIFAGTAIIVIQSVFGNKLKKYRIQLREANKEQYNTAYQTISGVKDIKVMSRVDYFVERYKEAYNNKIEADYGFCFAESVPSRIIESVCVLGLFIVLFWRISIGVDMAEFIPKLGAFAVAIFKIMPVMNGITNNLNGIVFKKIGLDATYDTIREIEVYENEKKDRLYEMEESNTVSFNDKINISNLTWSYTENGKTILQDISLNIHKGESIAFIGASGSGKTTLADIILGLFHPEKGTVCVDGINIRNIEKKWSNMVGYVSQTVFLIDDTIRNNVIFGLEDYVSDEDIWKALEMAQLKEYILSLPEQLETRVGERGVMLSGGQRQRIAIARAIIYNPDIIVLDEATSALDNETEKAVMDAIEQLHGKKTLIIIAHRLSTIEKCDRIYEIKDGSVREKRDKLKNEF